METAIDQRVAALEAIQAALKAKAYDPGATPEAPEWSVLDIASPAAELIGAVTRHNEQAERHDQVIAEQKQTVFDYLLGSRAEKYTTLRRKADKLAEAGQGPRPRHPRLVRVRHSTRHLQRERLRHVH